MSLINYLMERTRVYSSILHAKQINIQEVWKNFLNSFHFLPKVQTLVSLKLDILKIAIKIMVEIRYGFTVGAQISSHILSNL